MATEIACQGCQRRLTRHCPGSVECLWLECTFCQMIIGPRNVIFYGKTRRKVEDQQKRQNGV